MQKLSMYNLSEPFNYHYCREQSVSLPSWALCLQTRFQYTDFLLGHCVCRQDSSIQTSFTKRIDTHHVHQMISKMFPSKKKHCKNSKSTISFKKNKIFYETVTRHSGCFHQSLVHNQPIKCQKSLPSSQVQDVQLLSIQVKTTEI